jgi:hypothetical protein
VGVRATVFVVFIRRRWGVAVISSRGYGRGLLWLLWLLWLLLLLLLLLLLEFLLAEALMICVFFFLQLDREGKVVVLVWLRGWDGRGRGDSDGGSPRWRLGPGVGVEE